MTDRSTTACDATGYARPFHLTQAPKLTKAQQQGNEKGVGKQRTEATVPLRPHQSCNQLSPSKVPRDDERRGCQTSTTNVN